MIQYLSFSRLLWAGRGWGPLSYSQVTSDIHKSVLKLEQLSWSRPRQMSEQRANHGVTSAESDGDRYMPGQRVKIRIRSVYEWLLLNIKTIPLNNLIHTAIILFYNGTSAKLSMVSRRGCWPNTTCHLTATLLAWGATSLWWLTSLAQFLLQDPEFSSVFGSSRS